MVNLSRSCLATKITPRAEQRFILEVKKEPRTTCKELQASLALISVHDSTIRQILGKNGIHGRVPRQNSLLTKKNTKARLTFAKKYLDCPKDFWAKNLWTDETKVELSGRCLPHYIWHKTNTAFHKKKIIPTVKHGGGSVMVWGCYAASGPGQLAIIDGIMNSTLFQKILKLKRTWVMQQDNDLKHTSKSTSEWLKKNKIKDLEWIKNQTKIQLRCCGMTLNSPFMLVNPPMWLNLKQFCKKEWTKITPQ
uniref:Transposase Tc1-like domain-containing protein n=1 Tax=Cyprinus carpio TaxID=7962 RepID=A0A8C1UCV8_CYPCA